MAIRTSAGKGWIRMSISNGDTKKILTIAIPSYNIEEYIDRSVSSVARCNRLGDIEILIVNDGSTDKTADKARVYQEKYPHSIRIIDKQNGHYGSAVNAALEQAEGIFFKILDGDDEYYPDELAKLVSFMEANKEVDMILSDFEIFYEDTEHAERHHPDLDANKIYEFDSLNLEPYAMHGLSFRTETLRCAQVRLDEGVAFTDVEFVIYPIPNVKQIAYTDALVYSYKIGRTGQSVDIACVDKNMNSHETVLMSCFSWYSDIRALLSESKKQYIQKRIARMMDDHVYRCLISENPRMYLDALRNIAQLILSDHEINSKCKSRALKILYATHFLPYGIISFKMRNKALSEIKKADK